jgi:hypothetical protein
MSVTPIHYMYLLLITTYTLYTLHDVFQIVTSLNALCEHQRLWNVMVHNSMEERPS